jgi:hypothetical protein
MRRFLLTVATAATALTGAACSDVTGIGANVAGSYELTRVNGQSLPAPDNTGSVTFHAGVLELDSDGTFFDLLQYRVAGDPRIIDDEEFGTWERNGSEIRLDYDSGFRLFAERMSSRAAAVRSSGEANGELVRQAQVRRPGWIEAVGRHDDPHTLVWRARCVAQSHSYIRRRPVLLMGIAGTARRHDVLPRMLPSPTPRNDVVDVLGRAPAVLALVVVADEHRPARQRGPRPVRHPHVVIEAHDARAGDLEALGAENDTVRVQHLGLTLEGEYQRPPHRHDTQRLQGHIQNQCSSQGASIIGMAVMRP